MDSPRRNHPQQDPGVEVRILKYEGGAVLPLLAFCAKVATESQLARAGAASPAEVRRLAREGVIGGKKVLVNPPWPLGSTSCDIRIRPG